MDDLIGADSEPQCATVLADPDSNAVVVAVSGEIDMLTEPGLRTALHKALEQAPGRILIVDLTDVTFFGSTGVAALAEAHSLAPEQDTTVQLVATPSSPPHRSLAAMGLATRWSIHPTRTAALRPASPA